MTLRRCYAADQYSSHLEIYDRQHL